MDKILLSSMKPVPDKEPDINIKKEREDCLMNFLISQQYSVDVKNVAIHIGKFPGCDEPPPFEYKFCTDRYLHQIKKRAIVGTFRRLEGRQEVVSTIYHGRRYYSIPVEK